MIKSKIALVPFLTVWDWIYRCINSSGRALDLKYNEGTEVYFVFFSSRGKSGMDFCCVAVGQISSEWQIESPKASKRSPFSLGPGKYKARL